MLMRCESFYLAMLLDGLGQAAVHTVCSYIKESLCSLLRSSVTRLRKL
jgi:hypothetical protein